MMTVCVTWRWWEVVRRHAAEAALAEAQREDAAAWAAAEKAGWTAAELQAAGLSRPSKRAPGRPRKTKTAPAQGQGTQQNATANESQNH